MDRRSFLINALKVGAATAIAGTVSLVPDAESCDWSQWQGQ